MADYSRLFAYDRWANDEVIRALSAIANPPERAVKLIAHIIGTQYVWYARMTGSANGVAVWPAWSLEQTAAATGDMFAKWKELIARGDAFLREKFSYTNSKGEKWTSTNDDTLMHVAMHGAYHRGQIAAQVRAAGFEPPYTDYIQAARAGHVP